MEVHIDELYLNEISQNLFNGKANEMEIDTLKVSRWNDATQWTLNHTLKLIETCQCFNVECIHFVEERNAISVFLLSVSCIKFDIRIPKFIETNLKALIIDYACLSPSSLPLHFGILFTHTSIWSITFIIRDVLLSIQQIDIICIVRHMLTEKWLENGSNVMELRFETKDEKEIRPDSGPGWDSVKSLLKRNQSKRAKCIEACWIILGNRKVRNKIGGKDIAKIIIRMVWELNKRRNR
jgi:hypothetical protein